MRWLFGIFSSQNPSNGAVFQAKMPENARQ
jgi:hypothetical protein